MNKLLDFWMKIWLYVMAVGGGILIILLVLFWNQSNWATRLIYFTFIGLTLHVLEEWRFPGGFHYIYNLTHKSENPDRYPMNRVSDMVTNFGALIVGFGAIIIGAFPLIVVATFFFGFVEILAHTGLGINSYRFFKSKRKINIYNPGFLTTYVIFLPVSIGFIYIFTTGMFLTILTDWIWGIVLMLGIGFLLIVLPEGLLKNKNSPYAFTGKYKYGYYKKYVD